ncbi:hypothetical protein AMTRI_Chr04g180480 [Amborella trichopoda]
MVLAVRAKRWSCGGAGREEGRREGGTEREERRWDKGRKLEEECPSFITYPEDMEEVIWGCFRERNGADSSRLRWIFGSHQQELRSGECNRT